MPAFDIIPYFLNPAEHFLKRIIVFICLVFMVLVVDGYIGFSEFYFAKSKAESLEKISLILKDSTISKDNRTILQSDFNRIAQKESYKVVLFRFLRSINTKSIFIIDHTAHAPKSNMPTDFKIKKSSSIAIDFILYIISCGLFYWLTLFYFVFKLIFGGMAYRLAAKQMKVYRLLLTLISLAFLSPIIFILIPPYEFNTWNRFGINFSYHIVTLIIITIAIGISEGNKEKKVA